MFSHLGLERPSALEALLLADVRTYSLTAKVHVPGQSCAARTLLRGHTIAFVHEGPSTVSTNFDEARVKGALQHFQLVFVGSAGRQIMLERRALAMPEVRLRTRTLQLFDHSTCPPSPRRCLCAGRLGDIAVRQTRRKHHLGNNTPRTG